MNRIQYLCFTLFYQKKKTLILINKRPKAKRCVSWTWFLLQFCAWSGIRKTPWSFSQDWTCAERILSYLLWPINVLSNRWYDTIDGKKWKSSWKFVIHFCPPIMSCNLLDRTLIGHKMAGDDSFRNLWCVSMITIRVFYSMITIVYDRESIKYTLMLWVYGWSSIWSRFGALSCICGL